MPSTDSRTHTQTEKKNWKDYGFHINQQQPAKKKTPTTRWVEMWEWVDWKNMFATNLDTARARFFSHQMYHQFFVCVLHQHGVTEFGDFWEGWSWSVILTFIFILTVEKFSVAYHSYWYPSHREIWISVQSINCNYQWRDLKGHWEIFPLKNLQ